MVAHILTDSGFGCNAFLGGISVNYNTNFWSSDNNVAVVEADEYDRSFLKLSPDVALISAMDADHLDIYGTKENMEDSFIEFSEKLKKDGLLLTNYDLSCDRFSAHNHMRYSLKNNKADVFADNILISGRGYQFDIVNKNWSVKKIQLNMGGLHNVENAVAAITIAHYLNIEEGKIKKAVNNFQGVKRRFEYIISPNKNEEDNPQNDFIFIDDYAHHPQELNALISGAKNLFSDRKCTVIFQPHLFSRTRDFAHEFAENLDKADEILILPIYPARELPMEGVTSSMISQLMKNKNVRIISKEDLMDFVQNEFVRRPDDESRRLLITAGAGDIDKLVLPIKKILLNKF